MERAGKDAYRLVTADAALMSATLTDDPPTDSISALLQSERFSPETPEEAAAGLAWLAGDNPRVLIRTLRPEECAAFIQDRNVKIVTFEDLERYRLENEAALEMVAEADLPTAYGERPFRALSFRNPYTGVDHLAIISAGEPNGDPLVRIHSECLTGDALGSLRCDCGPQLAESLRRLAASPGGALVYMRGQEGRGIGLANKVRAYALQDKGLDTVEANLALGLPEDARNFAHAAQILKRLGYFRVRLLTNNPEKAASLERYSIIVSTIEPLKISPNPFNLNYLTTKSRKLGHFL